MTTGSRAKAALTPLLPAFLTLPLLLWSFSFIGASYQPLQSILEAAACFIWFLVGGAALVFSSRAMRPGFRTIPPLLRWGIVSIELVLALMLLPTIAVSAYLVHSHISGRQAYGGALDRCGHLPVLGENGVFGGDYILPSDTIYEARKYSVGEDSASPIRLFGKADEYFCTERDAIAAGYSRSDLALTLNEIAKVASIPLDSAVYKPMSMPSRFDALIVNRINEGHGVYFYYYGEGTVGDITFYEGKKPPSFNPPANCAEGELIDSSDLDKDGCWIYLQTPKGRDVYASGNTRYKLRQQLLVTIGNTLIVMQITTDKVGTPPSKVLTEQELVRIVDSSVPVSYGELKALSPDWFK
jgi:hypothetical protein